MKSTSGLLTALAAIALSSSIAAGTVTLTIHSVTFDDTWTWQPATDLHTPSQIEGKRGTTPLISLTPSDKAPTQ
jgi:hypothetical protein